MIFCGGELGYFPKKNSSSGESKKKITRPGLKNNKKYPGSL